MIDFKYLSLKASLLAIYLSLITCIANDVVIDSAQNYIDLKALANEVKILMQPVKEKYCLRIVKGINDFAVKQLKYKQKDKREILNFIKETYPYTHNCISRVDIRLPELQKLIKTDIKKQIKRLFQSKDMFKGISEKFECSVDEKIEKLYHECEIILKNESLLGLDVLIDTLKQRIDEVNGVMGSKLLLKLKIITNAYLIESKKSSIYKDENMFMMWIMKQFTAMKKLATLEFYHSFSLELEGISAKLDKIYENTISLHTFYADIHSDIRTSTKLSYIEILSREIGVSLDQYKFLTQSTCVFYVDDKELRNIKAKLAQNVLKIERIKYELKNMQYAAMAPVNNLHHDSMLRIFAYIETIKAPLEIVLTTCKNVFRSI